MAGMRNRRSSTPEERVEWLLNNRPLLKRTPVYVYGVEAELHHKPVVEEMKRAGLISHSTYWKDVSIRKLLVEARQKI